MFDDMPVAAEPQFTVYSTEQIMNMDLDQIKVGPSHPLTHSVIRPGGHPCAVSGNQRELDLRGIPYPPKKTREAFEERLLQAVMADTAGGCVDGCTS